MTDYIGIHIPRDMNVLLQKMARKYNSTVDDLIREAVYEYYEEERKDEPKRQYTADDLPKDFDVLDNLQKVIDHYAKDKPQKWEKYEWEAPKTGDDCPTCVLAVAEPLASKIKERLEDEPQTAPELDEYFMDHDELYDCTWR